MTWAWFVPISLNNQLNSASPLKTAPSQPRPDFFIVGAPKCGTTALAQYLENHPDIFMAKKELHFFGSDLQFGAQFYRRDLNAYLAEFAHWNGQTRAGEASVWYLFSRNAAAEIKAFNPDARILILLREPAAMLYSLYHQFLCDGNEHLPSFTEALAAESDRAAGRRIRQQTYLLQALAYRAVARYTEQVQRYFDAFGRDQVRVIIYDDFATDTPGVYRETLKFLGVAPGAAQIDFKVLNAASTVSSPLLRNLLNHPLIRGTAVAMRSWLPGPLFSKIQTAGIKLGRLNTRPDRRLPIAPEIELSLQCEFAPEVERLSALLGRDLTHWSRPKNRAENQLSPLIPQKNNSPAKPQGLGFKKIRPQAAGEVSR